jgi:uncharacterized protein (TIGR02246 family)
MSDERAREPEDITRLLVERVKAGDAEGVAALYEPDSVLAFPPGKTTVGREAIRAVYEGLIAQKIEFKPEEPLPTLRIDDLALTATRASDGALTLRTVDGESRSNPCPHDTRLPHLCASKRSCRLPDSDRD